MMQSNGDDFNALKMKKGKSDELALLYNETSLVGSIIIIGLWWAVDRGQFENVEQEGERILRDN